MKINKDWCGTVAALSDVFHRDGRFEKVYFMHGEEQGGFPAFYELVADAAIALERIARENRVSWGETHDWLASVDVMSQHLYDMLLSGRWPDEQGLIQLAEESMVEED